VGLGGVGKTQVALEYAHLTRKRHPECAIFWVPAIDTETFEQAFQTIGRQLGIPGVDEKGADVKTLVQSRLSQETAGEWLLIFDNADDLELWFSTEGKEAGSPDLVDYLPSSSRGSVLFTTRSWKVAGKLAYQNVIEVAEMNEDMASQILGNSLVEKEMLTDHETTLNLLAELTFLPLAIVQAAAYINVNKTTIAQYLDLLKDTESNVISVLSEEFEDEGRYRNSKNPIATTWLISFDQIRRRDTLAFEYLSLMACVEPKEIPRPLLLPGSSKKAETDALGTLKAYSFITERQESQSFDLHRLVHLATRNWLRQENLLRDWTEKAVTRLSQIFPDGENHEERVFWRILIPHARYILNAKIKWAFARGADLLYNYGQCLLEDGKYQEAERIFSEAVEIHKDMLGPDHISTLASMSNLACAYGEQGKWKKAEESNTNILEIRKRVIGPEHPDTLMNMNNLAEMLRHQKRWREAEELHAQVLETRKRILGPEHPETLISMSNLAGTFRHQKRWDEAEILGVQALEIRKRVLGQEHAGTLRSMNNLALTIERQGRWEDAEKLHDQCLKTRLRVLGPDHPGTLQSMNNLACTWNGRGRKDEAMKLMAECVQSRMNNLGQDHPHTKASKAWLRQWHLESTA
jgi:tetratricopeptide (TPR) repeat protein